MKVLIFHGYLLRGTGSNVYNANLAAALARLGHEVHLLCQERAPLELDFVDASGVWQDGELVIEQRRSPVRCTVYRPDIGGLLPVYVADRYEGIEARPFPELDEAEIDRYLEANVAAVRDVAARVRPDLALANHLVMGPVICARALGDELRYVVKVHGSALEYTVKPNPRFLPYAREGLSGAHTVLVGSRHTAESLWAALGDPGLPSRTRLGPPGVDIHAFSPRNADDGAAGVARLHERIAALARADTGEPADDSAFARDHGATAAALAQLAPGRERLVAYVGKLIVAKGVDLLLAAWPLVLERCAGARLVVVGFGAYRQGLERLAAALAAGDLEAVAAIAAEGTAAEGGPRTRLRYLEAFMASLDGERRARYLAAAAGLAQRLTFAGRLEHDELAQLLPACEALVVPSTFPESFGMVAAEAAACGALPVSAAHSGLAEVSDVLASSLPGPARDWLSFPLGDDAVERIAANVSGWLEATPELRAATREALVATAHERYSWEGVARAVIAAGQGLGDRLLG